MTWHRLMAHMEAMNSRAASDPILRKGKLKSSGTICLRNSYHQPKNELNELRQGYCYAAGKLVEQQSQLIPKIQHDEQHLTAGNLKFVRDSLIKIVRFPIPAL